MLPDLGWGELLLIVVVVLLLFGPSRLPELGRAIGKAIGAFKKGLKEGHEETSGQDKKNNTTGA